MSLTTDSLRSLVTGMGDPFRDKSASVFYDNIILSDSSLTAAYRNNWLPRKIVDIPAFDAVRRWRDWQASAEQITAIERTEKRLNVLHKYLECKKLARLYGGAAIYIGTDDPDTTAPLDPESIGLDGIKYLTVLGRRDIVAGELDRDPSSRYFGKPMVYTISGPLDWVDIHPSRLVIMVGNQLPDVWTHTGVTYGWGDSVIQSVYSAVTNADSTAANIANLVFEANVDVFAIPDLLEQVATQQFRTKLMERLTLANMAKGITRALLKDKEEEYTKVATSFAGLPDVLQSFLLITAGASDIPLTRLLGQSPAGLSSTGEHDMKNYFDRVEAIQSLEIGPDCHHLDEMIIRSALGNRPSELFYTWRPLEQLNEKERAEIGKIQVDAAVSLSQTGLFSPEEQREVTANQLTETGFYPGLGDLVKKNGTDLPEFDLERRAQEAGVEALENPPPPSSQPPVTDADIFNQLYRDMEQAFDARPMTLYMRRDVKNAAEIIKWYKDQGVPDVYAAESLHVTIAYSKTPLDWIKVGNPWKGELELPAGGPRLNELFGDNNDVLVLQFASDELSWRHENVLGAGGTSDYDEYQPHISISLKGGEVDLSQIKPYQGRIVLGPEIFEEIDNGDWRDKVKS